MVYSIVCKQQLIHHNLQRCRPRGYYKTEKRLSTRSATAKVSKRRRVAVAADSGASSDKDRPTILIYIYIYIYIYTCIYI